MKEKKRIGELKTKKKIHEVLDFYTIFINQLSK